MVMERVHDVGIVGLGALGSSSAWHAARRGMSVIGLEQFEFGHDQGASHDTSRIIRHSYHRPSYVALTFAAYDDWYELEAETGEKFVTISGGLDLFPENAYISIDSYMHSMAAHNVEFDLLEREEIITRWPQIEVPLGTRGLFQERSGIVPAARSVRAMQDRARQLGADLREHSGVRTIEQVGDLYRLSTDSSTFDVRHVVVAADAWTSPLLAQLDFSLELRITEEQVTYYEIEDPEQFRPGVFPVWIWMDEPSFYGFPTYGEDTVKASHDVGGPEVTLDSRSGAPDPVMEQTLQDFMNRTFPSTGGVVRSKRCLYALPRDREMVISTVPDHPRVAVLLGSAQGMKFAACVGRFATELIHGEEPSVDISDWRLDRPGITDPDFIPDWMN
jgi:sarcosine oxidase